MALDVTWQPFRNMAMSTSLTASHESRIYTHDPRPAALLLNSTGNQVQHAVMTELKLREEDVVHNLKVV
jgi:hypothetical protein